MRAGGGYDIVHSWGVLHHTGDMAKAFTNAALLVKPEGHLIVSIYNRHWTSGPWRTVKRFFNLLPSFLQEIISLALYPLFYLRARALSGKSAPQDSRGMDLHHAIADWLGGYPYEYASPAEVEQAFQGLGFRLLRCDPTNGFTGCNEFVFQKKT